MDEGSAEPEALAPGTRIGPYEILEVAGLGGMGVVYRARDTRLEREVAIKCPDRDLAEDAVARMRFTREARAAARLSHPHIVQVHEVFEHDELPWLVMQLVRGPTLREVLDARGALPLEDVLRWAEELAGALGHAHEQGILHRDIKPRNILITADGRALITDFGLARRLEVADPEPDARISTQASTRTESTGSSLTWDGSIVGTPAYMSPEQALGRPLDRRSDVFSLGAVLYEMCTGRALFAHDALRGLFETGSHEPPEIRKINPAVPVELERIVQKALAWRPEDRYPSATALGDDLRAFRRLVVSTSRRRYRLALGVSLALLAAAVGIVVWILEHPHPNHWSDAIATGVVTWPSRETEGRISPDKRWLSFLSDRDGGFRVWLRSLEGSLEQPLTLADEAVESHVWSADGQEIAYLVDADTQALLRVVPALGGPPRTIATFESRYVNARLLRWIGTRIYVELWETLLRYDTTRRELDEILPAPQPPAFRAGFDVRPNERRVAYTANGERGTALWTSDLDGRNAEPVPFMGDSEPSPQWPHWAAGEIVYTSNRSGQPDLWSVDPQNGRTERITLSPWSESVSDASADGSMLAFVHQIDESHLWALERESGESYQLTADALGDSWMSTGLSVPGLVVFQRAAPSLDDAGDAIGTQILLGTISDGGLHDSRVLTPSGEQPLLSPNGEWLVYARGRELWVRNIHTGEDLLATSGYPVSGQRLFPFTFVDRNVAWSPSSSAIYFVTRTGDGVALECWPLEPRGEPRSIAPVQDGTLLHDLLVSADGASLVFVASGAFGYELRSRNLDTDEELALLRMKEQVRPLAWLDPQTLLVTRTTNYPDSTQALELLAVEKSGRYRTLGAVDHAYADTATFDSARSALLVTAVTGADVHNVVELQLASGRSRAVTNNRTPGVSFSALQALPSGLLLYARQERAEDIWIVESARRGRRR